MRARMGLAYSQISYEHREILLRDRPKILYDLSPKGTVPVLNLQDGTVIDESIDIMRWALIQNDPNCWYKDHLKEQDNLIKVNDVEFKPKLDKYKYSVRYPENNFLEYQRDISKYLYSYDRRLKSNKFMIGDYKSLADIALMPFIRQCANVDSDWFSTQFPYLDRWLYDLVDSILFNKIMVKHDVWDSVSVGTILKWN